jgi:hypothetical protein
MNGQRSRGNVPGRKRIGVSALGRIGVEAEASFFNSIVLVIDLGSRLVQKINEDDPRREVSASLADTPLRRHADTFPPAPIRRYVSA